MPTAFALTRAQMLHLGAALSFSAVLPRLASAQPPGAVRMNTRPIPATREALPVIGCGTWIGFNVDPGGAEQQRLAGVLEALFAAGGSVIDSSPMYGRAEAVAGDLLVASKARERAFLATKVWTSGRDAGIAQMEESLRRLRTERIDLMQVHNLVDWRTHLKTLRGWKDQGRVRYIGITHYTSSAYAEVEAVLRAEKLDFLQINYSLDARQAEQRLLPLAAERGVAVIVNLPFGGGGLLRRLRDKPLPGWAAEIGCTSWAQLLLKFVLGHPAVTCTIPGTGSPQHMADNAAAGAGALPDAAFWRRHAADLQV
jgi:diketogulonate reductase-like aldo/keto reductase